MELFNLIVRHIFYRCIDSFPSESEFTIQDIFEDIQAYYPEDHLDKEQTDDAIFSTVIWLKDEGYLKDRGSDQDCTVVIPTQRALVALNQKFKLNDKTFLESFKKGVVALSIPTTSSLITEFLKSS